ncbi:MAG: hypothetical protein IT244_12305 [Bacteroidia bacterium]|nr:hypothetical protein [Bacteroidia bacterium]
MKNFKLFIALGLWNLGVSAQQNFTLYPMSSIPQANMMNVANVPDCKWHIGIPALNSTYLQYSNGGFNLNKFFTAVEYKNSDTTVLNLNKLLDILAKKNYISMRVEQSWLQGGLKFGNHYFHGNVTEKLGLRVSLPKDLFRFIIDGNGGPNLGETFSFAFKTDATHYREYGIGYSYELPGKLQVGGRLKILKGYNIIETKDLRLDITTRPSDYAYLLKANVLVNASSVAGQIIPTDSNATDFSPQFFKSKNNGFGLDLGAAWQFNDKIRFSASLIDLGYIKWTQNTTNLFSKNPNAGFTYDGIHIKSSDTGDYEQYVGKLIDTLLTTFGIDTAHRSFNSALSTEFFLNASYQINKKAAVGALFYGDFYNKRFYPGLTLNFQYKVGKALSLNVTNTMYNRSWFNVGLGTSINVGPWQVYSVMDNVLFPFAISSLKTFSWRFGSNLTFGRERSKPKKQKNSDGGGLEAPTDPGTI